LDVPNNISPSGSSWCWASCVTMATNYYGNNTDECEIVEWTRLNIPYPDREDDNCCSFPDSCFGGLLIGDIEEVLGSENLNCTFIHDIVSLNSLQSAINDNRPLIIQGHHNSPYGWHTMIIKGYDESYIHYNDGGSSYITLYDDAITYECMGTYLWRWQDYTHVLTDQPCPVNLNITQDINADADIKAQNSITLSCEIGENRLIKLTSGGELYFNSEFYMPLGSTLDAVISQNPCQ
jgi:hypothetical protein